MEKVIPKYPRILAIAPSREGIGFAVMDGLNNLINWGVKWTRGDKNKAGVAKAKELIVRYEPEVIALEDASADGSHRGRRLRELMKRIVALSANKNVPVALFSRKQMKWTFLLDGDGTRHDLVAAIAARFPDELGRHLPPERRPWMDEDHRMAMFDAVALALMVRTSRRL